MDDQGDGPGVAEPPSATNRQLPSACRAQRVRYFMGDRSTLPSGDRTVSTAVPTVKPRSPLSVDPAKSGVQLRIWPGFER